MFKRAFCLNNLKPGTSVMRFALVAALVWIVGPQTALAQPAADTETIGQAVEDVIPRVQALYQGLYFDEAMILCEQTLAGGGHTMTDTISLLRWQGILAGTQGKGEEAQAAFQRLLVIDPDADLGEGHAPRIVQAFADAKAWYATQTPLAVTVDAPPDVSRFQNLTLSLRIDGNPLGMAQKAALHLRAANAPTYERLLAASPPFSWNVQLDNLPNVSDAAELEYHISVLDITSNEIALRGTPALPATLTLTDEPPPHLAMVGASAEPPTPWYKTWWFWTAVGVAVVGAGVTTGVILAQPSSLDATITVQN